MIDRQTLKFKMMSYYVLFITIIKKNCATEKINNAGRTRIFTVKSILKKNVDRENKCAKLELDFYLFAFFHIYFSFLFILYFRKMQMLLLLLATIKVRLNTYVFGMIFGISAYALGERDWKYFSPYQKT